MEVSAKALWTLCAKMYLVEYESRRLHARLEALAYLLKARGTVTDNEMKAWEKHGAGLREANDMLATDLVDMIARDAPRRVEIRASGVVAERIGATLDQEFNDLLALAGAAYLDELNEKGDESA